MQMTVERDVLAHALESLERTIGNNNLPVATCIYMDVDIKTATAVLRSTDGAFTTVTSVPVKSVKQAGEVLIDGSLLAGLVKTYSVDEVTLKSDKKFGVEISADKSHARIHGMDTNLVIKEPILGATDRVMMKKKDLAQAISTIEFARLKKTNNQQDYKLKEIGLRIENGVMTLTANDRSRVAVSYLPTPGAPDLDMIVPYKAFSDVLSWAQEDITLNLSPNMIQFESGAILYYSPLYAEKLSNLQKFMAVPNDVAVIDRISLLRVLTRADVLTRKSDDSPGVITLTMSTDTVHISGESTTGSAIHEDIPATNPWGTNREAHIYGRFLLDAIQRMNTQHVLLYLPDPAKFILAFPEGKTDENSHLIMTVHTS